MWRNEDKKEACKGHLEEVLSQRRYRDRGVCVCVCVCVCMYTHMFVYVYVGVVCVCVYTCLCMCCSQKLTNDICKYLQMFDQFKNLNPKFPDKKVKSYTNSI